MWEKIARFILRSRWMLLILLLALTVLMGYHASRVQMSYEFARAIPTDNPKYQAYQAFRSQFGEDGNLMAIGVQTEKLFQAPVFNDYAALAKEIGVELGRCDRGPHRFAACCSVLLSIIGAAVAEGCRTWPNGASELQPQRSGGKCLPELGDNSGAPRAAHTGTTHAP